MQKLRDSLQNSQICYNEGFRKIESQNILNIKQTKDEGLASLFSHHSKMFMSC